MTPVEPSSTTQPIPFAPEVSNEEEPTDSGVVISSLKFYTGRRRGQSCSYNGFLYSHNRSKADGHSYWECKSRKSYSPACKGRLTPLGSTVTKVNPHCHLPSIKDVEAEHILSNIRGDNTAETAGNVVRTSLQAEGKPTSGRQQQRAQHRCRMLFTYDISPDGHPLRTPSCISSRRVQGYKQQGSPATTPSRWRSELRRLQVAWTPQRLNYILTSLYTQNQFNIQFSFDSVIFIHCIY